MQIICHNLCLISYMYRVFVYFPNLCTIFQLISLNYFQSLKQRAREKKTKALIEISLNLMFLKFKTTILMNFRPTIICAVLFRCSIFSLHVYKFRRSKK